MKTKFSFFALPAMAALMLSAAATVLWPASAAFAVTAKPDLIILQVEPNASTANAGATLSVADTVKNQGPADAKKFTVLYGLSSDTSYYGKGDIKIGGGSFQRVGMGLVAGASSASSSFSFEIPMKTPPGTYHVCATVSSSPGESDRSNNTLCSTGTVTVPQPDLVVSALSTTTTSVNAGKTIQVSLSVMNQGGSVSNTSKVELHASSNAIYGDGDDIPSSIKPSIAKLNPGQSKILAHQAVKVPSTPGSYFICAKTDVVGVVTEGDETNNTLCTATQITVLGPAGAANEWLLVADDGSPSSNNVTAFLASATAPASPISAPIPMLGAPLNFNTLALGEIHFANGKGYVVITSGLAAPAFSGDPGDGGIAVMDLTTGHLEQTVTLASSLLKTDTNHASARIVHTYIDPEGKYLWANNDGPSGDNNPDSVFRLDVDPASPGYLTYVEIPIGNGHKKMAFGRPSTALPDAPKLVFISSLTERRVDVIDDDSTHVGAYGTIVKIVRNVGASPHGFDYSATSGRAFTGLTGGGVVMVDGTKVAGSPADVDCNGITDNYCVTTGTSTPDPSVYKITTGPAGNPGMFGGYVHVHEASGNVYTTGYSGAATKGWLTYINPGTGTNPPVPTTAIDLGDLSPSNFAGQDKFYIPSSGNGAIHNLVRVVDPDPASPTFNTILTSVTVGTATGENRNLRVSPDERVVMVPNTATNTVSVIDTDTDTVIDTLTLSSGTTAKNMGIAHLPVSNPENNR